MTIEYKLPELGEDIETGDVVSVYVSPGDSVTEDQPLMEIETDKAAIEIPSPADGVIKEVLVSDGETIKVGQLLVKIEDGSGSSKEPPAKETETEQEPEEVTEDNHIEEEPEKEPQEEPIEAEAVEEEKAELDPEPQVEEEKEESEEPEVRLSQEQPEEDNQKEIPEIATNGPVPASPTVRRLARELGIDINTVKGSGPGGRISEQDLRASAGVKHSKESAKEPVKPETKAAPQKKAPAQKKASSAKPGEEERVKMSKVRKITAERLTAAWTAPHVTQYDKADVTELEGLRKQYGTSVEKAGGKLTMTSILIKVIAKTLKDFPEMNSSVDMENAEIIFKNYYNIGIAVDTDRGLLVPVVRDADQKTITQLSVELTDISERARTKKITPDELGGGTFTITNLGGIGGTYFSPVLNAPEVGILGVSRSQIEPVYIEEEFVPRLMLPLSLSYDHRIVDGANAIRFLRAVIDKLEEPHSWFLKVN